MTNKEIVERFFTSYQQHDHAGMKSCLHPSVQFDDMAFNAIRGPDVFAMWQWFCHSSDRRKDPVAVPSFQILHAAGDEVTAKYRVRYTLQERREVDYEIKAQFTIRQGQIVKHQDRATISQFAFARMAVGFPGCLAALTPLFQWKLRRQSLEKLREFQAANAVP